MARVENNFIENDGALEGEAAVIRVLLTGVKFERRVWFGT